MAFRASQPGKTAPKFLNDLLRFDPSSVRPGRNILLEHPPQYEGDSKGPSLVLDSGSCKHEYLGLPNHCNPPQLDERPQPHTKWMVAAMCKKCRIHLRLRVEYPPEAEPFSPCPTKDSPLHHLRLVDTNPNGVRYLFACSNTACLAFVAVEYAPPVLTQDDLHLLTDGQALDRRHRAVLDNDPDREGVRKASPSDVFFRLKRYVGDSLDEKNARRSFPAWNKRFMEAFGTDCDVLLQRLGFTKEGEGIEGDAKWKLPSPEPACNDLADTPMRNMLEWLVMELQILIDKYCASHATPNPSPRVSYQDAKPDLERTLSAQGYDKVPGRNLAPTEEDHPYYGSLGALGDFSDKLIAFCYERQVVCDPEQAPYYFDCLHGLATGRSSESLIMKSTTLASQDVLSKKDIDQAYKLFDVLPGWGGTVSDDDILNKYRARWSSSGPGGKTDLKVALKKLGQARGSRVLLDTASDSVETYEQALAYLGAEISQPDDTIVALYGVKAGDDAMATDTARRAVSTIAKARGSDALLSWLATGEMSTETMGIDEACSHLNIQLDTVDPSMLDFVFESAQMDRPGTITDKAIAAVRKAFADRQNASPSHTTETWPVGLISHGNTCYLNSLLQYYFTIKPLRQLVLNFDKFKYDLASQGAKAERVGNLHRPDYEIESFQKLTNDLRQLFERMIKDRGPAVRPETDLVCRAFLKPVSPQADTTGTQHADSVDVNMTSTEHENPPSGEANATKAEADASSTASLASSVTLAGSVQGGEASQTLAPPTPPASPKPDKDGEASAPPLPPRRPATPRQKTNLEKAEEAARQQQDVAEVMEELLTRLRASIKPLGQDSQGEQLDQLREIFNMRIMDTVIQEGQRPLTKEDDFTNLMLLPPYEATDIYSALDRVLDIHPEGSFDVYKTIRTFPPILQISINRILMGPDGKPAKSEHRIRLEETLYMDRYSDDETVLGRRRQCWEWRRRLRSLQAEKEIIQKTNIADVDGPTAMDGVSDWLSTLPELQADLEEAGVGSLGVPESLSTALSQESGFQRAKLTVIEKEERELEAQLAKQFAGNNFEKIKYRLHAVFFHRGSTGHGHYWTYIYDIQQNLWRVYNDEKVEQFDKVDDILNAHTWQHGTPTYAVYVRDDTKEQFVEPVCRDVEEAVDEPMPDLVEPEQTTAPDTSNASNTSNAEALAIAAQGVKGDWDIKSDTPPVITNW